MRDVTLSKAELQMAATCGVQRHIEALEQGKQDSFGYDGLDGWTVHIEGAAGELAIAKVIQKYWPGTVNTFKNGGDIGKTKQVRTRSKHEWDLIVRPGDRDEDIFFLVTGRAPSYKVWGWIKGADAKKKEWLKTHGGRPPAYFVPKDALTPIN